MYLIYDKKARLIPLPILNSIRTQLGTGPNVWHISVRQTLRILRTCLACEIKNTQSSKDLCASFPIPSFGVRLRNGDRYKLERGQADVVTLAIALYNWQGKNMKKNNKDTKVAFRNNLGSQVKKRASRKWPPCQNSHNEKGPLYSRNHC